MEMDEIKMMYINLANATKSRKFGGQTRKKSMVVNQRNPLEDHVFHPPFAKKKLPSNTAFFNTWPTLKGGQEITSSS